MDSPFDVEALRARLKAMDRGEFLKLAEEAGVPQSTADKFRNGHSGKKRGSFTPILLTNALAAREAAALAVSAQSRKKARA